MGLQPPTVVELERYERLHREAPDSRAFAQLADAYRRAGRLREAIDLLRQGIANHPEYVAALVLLGDCYVAAERDDAAGVAFARVFELDPDNLVALRYRAKCAARRGGPEQARSILKRVLEIDPYDREARARLQDPLSFHPDAVALPEPEAKPARAPSLQREQPPPAPEPATEHPEELEIGPLEIHLDRIPGRPTWGNTKESESRGPIRSVEEKVWETVAGQSPLQDELATQRPPSFAPPTALPEVPESAAPQVAPASRPPELRISPPVEPVFDRHLGDEFATLMVARIYESQGCLQQALAIYQELHRKQPQDANVAERLEALQRRLSGGGDAPSQPPAAAGRTPAAALPAQVSQVTEPAKRRLGDSASVQDEARDAAQEDPPECVPVAQKSDSLLSQLRIATDDETELKIGEYLIDRLDGRGYLTCTLAEAANSFRVDLAIAEKVLGYVQNMGSVGIGARNLQEALLIQLRHRGLGDSLTTEIVRNHFDALKQGNYNKIAKKLRITVEHVQEQANIIKDQLEGLAFGRRKTK